MRRIRKTLPTRKKLPTVSGSYTTSRGKTPVGISLSGDTI
jgi:hypothetical protein